MYSLTLQNAAGDSVITSGDILGRINFAVPAESDGFSATYISSFINCSADGVFTSGSNPAGLVFGVSSADPNAATGVLKISSDGHIMPLASGLYDLGSSSLPFRNLYVDAGFVAAPTGVFDVISFNVDDESILTKGQISWDDTEGTMDIGLTDNTTIHIGEHRYFRIRNETGGVLYKGQVVYATGVHSNGLITPSKYVADGSVREVRFMGVVLEDVNNQNNGYVVDFGHLQDMDLDGSASNYAVGDETWVAGDILYVHPTGAGKLTKNEPKHSISVAIVLDPGNGNGNGRMFVRPTSYGHLDDNHDVAVSGATNGQFLQYNSATDYWVPSSSGNFTTLLVNGTPVPTGVGTSNYVTKWTGTNSIGNSLIYDNGTNVGIGTSSPSSKLHVNGNATFSASSGVPVTITNTGTGNSFVVNDASGDTTPFVVDAAGKVGVGTTPTTRAVTVRGGGTGDGAVLLQSSSTGTGTSNGFIIQCFGASSEAYVWNFENAPIIFGANNAERMRLTAAGDLGLGPSRTAPASRLDVNGVITVSATSGSAGAYAPSLTFSGDPNTGFGQVSGQSDTASIFTAGHERVRVDASGRVGINISNPSNRLSVVGQFSAGAVERSPNNSEAAGFYDRLEVGGGTQATKSYGSLWVYNSSNSQTHQFHSFAGTDNYINNGGKLGVGTSSPSALLDINSDKIRLRTAKTPASASDTGNAGDICWDASYLYICTATNTWRRIAHSTW